MLTASFCLCGIIAAITRVLWAKVLLGTQGTIYSLIVIKHLLDHAFQETIVSRMNRINKVNIITTVFIWPLFVVTWGFGPDVYNIISGEQELIIETSLSLLLKSVSGLYAFLVYREFNIQQFGDTLVETLQNYMV
jgi:bacteriorhodopsin